jgi:hypothetical protein
MSLESTYYSVSTNISPFDFGGAKKVGCYLRKETAERAANFIRLIFQDQLAGGIDVKIHSEGGEITETPLGVRLKEIQNGSIKIIEKKLSKKEINRIIHLT